MSYAYPRSTGASSLPSFGSKLPSSRLGLVNQTWDRVPSAAKQWFSEGVASLRSSRPRSRREVQSTLKLGLKRLFRITSAVIVLWLFTLWWGERAVFQESIDACAWEAWEAWVSYC